jgi:hypothetical protein
LFLERRYLIASMSGIKAMVTWVKRGHGGTADCRKKYYNVSQELVKHYCETCPVCMKKNIVSQPERGSRKPI